MPAERPVKARVAVIGGGQNCEHEVSLASAAAVALALEHVGYQVVRLTIGVDGTWRDGGVRRPGLAGVVRILGGCDVVVPVVHGEDGTLAALCDLAGVTCVGSGLRAGALAMDKQVTKLIAADCGIATAPAELLTATTAAGYQWTRPVVIKPVAAGSSRGVTLVAEPARLSDALAAALTLDDRVLAEDVISGREIDLAVLGRPAAPARSHHPWRSWATGSSATRTSTAATLTCGCPPPSVTMTASRSQPPPSPCSTLSAARESPGSTSSSPPLGRSSTRSTPCQASRSTHRYRRCSPPPACPIPNSSTS
jgi:D-ala D-ala ligase N-terminus/D-ala D-ala ligase C-terminus